MGLTSLGLTPERQLGMNKAETERKHQLAMSGYYGAAAKKMAEDVAASEYARSAAGQNAAIYKSVMPGVAQALVLRKNTEIAHDMANTDRRALGEKYKDVKLGPEVASILGMDNLGALAEMVGGSNVGTLLTGVSRILESKSQSEATKVYRNMQILGGLNADMGKLSKKQDPDTMFPEITDPAERQKKLNQWLILNPGGLLTPEDKQAMEQIKFQQRLAYQAMGLPEPRDFGPTEAQMPSITEDSILGGAAAPGPGRDLSAEMMKRQGIEPYEMGQFDVGNALMNFLSR